MRLLAYLLANFAWENKVAESNKVDNVGNEHFAAGQVVGEDLLFLLLKTASITTSFFSS